MGRRGRIQGTGGRPPAGKVAQTEEQKAESDNALVKSLARLTKPKFLAAASSFKPMRNQDLPAFEPLWDVITVYRKTAT